MSSGLEFFLSRDLKKTNERRSHSNIELCYSQFIIFDPLNLLSICGLHGDVGALALSLLYVIVGHLKLISWLIVVVVVVIVGDDAFDAHSVHAAVEFEMLRLCFDVLRPRPKRRNENERRPNVELSHSALKLILSAFTLLFEPFLQETTKLFALCFRLFVLWLESCSQDAIEPK